MEIMIGSLLYEIEETGLIRKRRGKGYLTMFPDKDGYLKVAVSDRNNKTYNAFVHRLVYEAFNGPIPQGMTVDHIDNNRLNNVPSNLQLLTPEENAIKGNAKHWKLVSPEGEVVDVYNMTAFCKENGLHPSHMMDVAKGKPKYKAHRGWSKYYG